MLTSHHTRFARLTLALLGAAPAAGLGGTTPALAQESSPKISIGSTRIGGPGATDTERRRVAAWNAEEEDWSEENIPAPGHKKRLVALHWLAAKYAGGKAWGEACAKYDTIIDEGGDEALTAHPEGKANAAKSYFGCARSAFTGAEWEKTERLLKKSEKYGGSSSKHANMREKMLRESYRRKLIDGDIGGAIQLYDKAQAMRNDDDERIWLGEQLSRLAWAAYNNKDRVALDDLLARIERISPMNTEYRRLQEKMSAEENIFKNAFGLAALAVGIVAAGSTLSRWAAKRRVERLTGKNKFEDDDL